MGKYVEHSVSREMSTTDYSIYRVWVERRTLTEEFAVKRQYNRRNNIVVTKLEPSASKIPLFGKDAKKIIFMKSHEKEIFTSSHYMWKDEDDESWSFFLYD